MLTDRHARARALPVLALLAALGGCAANQAPGAGARAQPDPATLAVANRLPPQVTSQWVRRGPADGDSLVGIFVTYRQMSIPGVATIAFVGNPDAHVPDGPDAPRVLEMRPELRPGAATGATRLHRTIAGAPEQRCIRRIAQAGPVATIDYTCGTGVASRAMITRITAQVVADRPREIAALDFMVGVLLTGTTRAAAGQAPPIPPVAPTMTQQQVDAAFGLVPIP